MVGLASGLSEFDGLGQGRRNLLLEILRRGELDTHGVSRATGGRIHVHHHLRGWKLAGAYAGRALLSIMNSCIRASEVVGKPFGSGEVRYKIGTLIN